MSFWKKLLGGGSRPSFGGAGEMMTVPQLDKALHKLMATGLGSKEVLGRLRIECPNCGPYTEEAKQLLVIFGIHGGGGGAMSHVFADPNMAAAATAFKKGQCICGAQKFRVTFIELIGD